MVKKNLQLKSSHINNARLVSGNLILWQARINCLPKKVWATKDLEK